MTDTKELVERVRRPLEPIRYFNGWVEQRRDALAALSELEKRLEAAERLVGRTQLKREAAERERDEARTAVQTQYEVSVEAIRRGEMLEEALREIAEPFGDNDHAEHCLIHRRIAKHALNKT